MKIQVLWENKKQQKKKKGKILGRREQVEIIRAMTQRAKR